MAAHREGDAQSTPFAEALRAAIDARGVPLSRLRSELSGRGHAVSVATLSYWQSGRSQPERAASLETLGALEDLLGLDDGELRMLVDAPRPRGRTSAVPEVDTTAIVAGWAELERQGRANLERIRRQSIHLVTTVDANRRGRTEARATGRVHAESADRISVYLGQEGTGHHAPEVLPRRGGTLGPTHLAPAGNAVISEILFPETLPRGSTFTVEYGLLTHQDECSDSTLIELFRTGLSVISVGFDPDALPRDVRLVETPNGGSATTTTLALRPDHSVVVARTDYGPGRLSVTWDW